MCESRDYTVLGNRFMILMLSKIQVAYCDITVGLFIIEWHVVDLQSINPFFYFNFLIKKKLQVTFGVKLAEEKKEEATKKTDNIIQSKRKDFRQ